MRKISIGTINIGDKVDITDPSYGKSNPYRLTLQNMSEGAYDCFAYVSDSKRYGQQVRKVRIVRAGTQPHKDAWEHLGVIAVDSGFAGFFADKPNFLSQEWREFCDWMFSQVKTKDRSDPLRYTYLAKMKNQTDGFWSHSGTGDGVFNVYTVTAIFDGKVKVIAAEIRFVEN